MVAASLRPGGSAPGAAAPAGPAPHYNRRSTSGSLMQLTPRETEKLLIYVAADLARRRRERGLKLNLPEATALITEAMLEGARDGRRVSEVRALGRRVLTRDDVMDEVPELLTVVHVEATFPDGTKLISCHDPIP
jgi:urease subunit gamma